MGSWRLPSHLTVEDSQKCKRRARSHPADWGQNRNQNPSFLTSYLMYVCGFPHHCRNCGISGFECVPLFLLHFLTAILQVLFLKGQHSAKPRLWWTEWRGTEGAEGCQVLLDSCLIQTMHFALGEQRISWHLLWGLWFTPNPHGNQFAWASWPFAANFPAHPTLRTAMAAMCSEPDHQAFSHLSQTLR